MFSQSKQHNGTSEFIHKHVNVHHHALRYILFSFKVAVLAAFSFSISAQELSVPAEFKKMLTIPGEGNQLLRPARIVIDSDYNEVFISDRGNNRILIFTADGILKYEIYSNDLFGMPIDFTVGKDGRIYVLGSQVDGLSIFVFEYDGVYLETISLNSLSSNSRFINSIVIDELNRFYLFDQEKNSIYILDSAFNLLKTFSIEPDDKNAEDEKPVVGLLTYHNNYIYVPLSNIGTVAVYDSNGTFIRYIGVGGVLPGQLSFPANVAVTKNNIICVLDKNRFNVVCYDQEGNFLGEFGGKGYRAGWFYHPTWIAADNQGNVFIGQTYMNFVQKCTIPEFIFDRLQEFKNNGGDSDDLSFDINSYLTPNTHIDGAPSINFGGFKHA